VQPVVVGRSQEGQVVVSQGLNGGETVVVDGALLLTEGTKVELREPQKGAS
jgi:membrane fusion protein, multidrug efflux system